LNTSLPALADKRRQSFIIVRFLMSIVSRRRGLARTVVAGASAAMLAGLCVNSAKADTPKQSDLGTVSIRSILLFPIANDSGAAGDDVAPKIDDAVRIRLNAVNKFQVTRFSRLLPTVQRGLEDKDLTEQDVQTPFGDTDKDQPRAARIAQRMDVDSYFVGNLDTFKADPTTKTVSLQVTGTLYDTRTGGSAKTGGASVTEKPQSASDNLDTVIQAAVNDAAGQIASGINALPVTPQPVVVQTSQRGHSISGGSVLLAIAAGALLYAAFHHDSSSSSSSSSTSGSGSGGGLTPPSPPTTQIAR
jgi:hypothetical protein